MSFEREEIERSDTAIRLGIDNTYPDELQPNIDLARQGMGEIAGILGVRPTTLSWYRCEALERVLCAKDFAAWCTRHRKNPATAWDEYFKRKGHPQGVAVDWVAPGWKNEDAAKMVAESGLKFDQLILEGKWVHTSFARSLRRQILNATFTNGTPQYSTGLG